MFGALDDGRRDATAPLELVRLAFPRRVYTQSHFDYVAEVILRARGQSAPGPRRPHREPEQVPAPLHGGAGVGLTRAECHHAAAGALPSDCLTFAYMWQDS